ncbi:MAG TPA: hypothetical protein VMN78_05045 [Longimicrobiales bacterium]|nr:hypothetical protein [Longimicrobiales bacterium]
MRTASTTALILALALPLGACAGGGAGGLGDILGTVLGGPQPASSNVGQLVVQVQGVDQQNQQIAVLTEDGQRGNVLYDRNTRVVYQQQEYPVTALERGDVVEMRVQEIQQGLYTDYILVRQSVQQGGGVSGGDASLVQASGTVRQIEYQRGWFDLETSQGVITVTMPYNPPSTTVSQFERLDRGDRVTIEGYLIANDRIELVRFR